MKGKIAIVKWVMGEPGNFYHESPDKQVRTFKYDLPKWCWNLPREDQVFEAKQELAKLAYGIGILVVTPTNIEVIDEN